MYNIYLRSSSTSKLGAKITLVHGTSLPLAFVVFPFESNDPEMTDATVEGYFRSSQHREIVVCLCLKVIASPPQLLEIPSSIPAFLQSLQRLCSFPNLENLLP